MLRDIQPALLAGFLREKRANTSTATAKLARRVLSGFFNYCVDNSELPISPVPSSRALKLNKDSKSARRAFTLRELKTIFDKCPNDFWKYMVLAGFYCGQRMGDLICLPWAAVDLEHKQVRLTQSKTGKAVVVPLRNELADLIAELKEKAGPVKPADAIWPEQCQRYQKFGAGGFSNEFYDEVLLPAGLVPKRPHTAIKRDGTNRTAQGNVSQFSLLEALFCLVAESDRSNAGHGEGTGRPHHGCNERPLHARPRTGIEPGDQTVAANRKMNATTIQRPPYQSVPLETGLRWNYSADIQFAEKIDSIWHKLTIGTSIIVGELMRDGRFFAFDLPLFAGADVRNLPRRERLEILDGFKLLRPESSSNGGELLQRVLARGGEGICAAHWQGSFNDTVSRCKRVETHDCVVTEKHGRKQSVRLAENGVDRGWCPAAGGNADRLNIGDVVEVQCYSITAKEKFREPRLARIRRDKMEGKL